MPSHMSCIGFPVASDEEFGALLKTLMPKCSEIRARDGVYLRWTSECGAEVWLQGDPKRQLTGVTPYFSGEGRVRVGITALVQHESRSPLDGTIQAWADPEDEDPEKGAFPFLFDCPDFLCYETLNPPSLETARVTAFAHELEIHESPQSFLASQGEEGPRMASKCFIPSGLFGPERESGPAAEATFTGHVLKAEKLKNPMTDAAFWWALVESVAGTWDVVADPAQVDRPLAPGQVLSGTFWLCGRLEGDWLPRRKGMLRWFFGG